MMIWIMIQKIENIQNLIDEYTVKTGIWNDDEHYIHILKKAVNNLNDADKIIFVLYCEYQSLRKVGELLGLSHTIIFKEIKRINELIYDYIKINSNNNNSELLSRFKWHNNND